MDRRTRTILVFCALVFILTGCCTPGVIPDNSGDIVETQTDVATGAETVATGAESIEAGAMTLAGTLAGLAQSDPSLAPVAAQAASHSEATKIHAAEARKLQASVEKARIEVVNLMKRSAQIEGLYQEEQLTRIKAEGERNLAIAIIGGIILAGAVYLYLKIRGFP